MTGHTRSLLLVAGGGVLVAALILFAIRESGSDDSPIGGSEPSSSSGLQRAMERLRNPNADLGRVHRPDRNVPETEDVEDREFEELWQILEDEQAADMVKESAALKLAARGGAEAISQLWELWQAGKLPPSCSWIVDMANTGTGLEAGKEFPPRRLPTFSAERIGTAVAQLMNADLAEDERHQAARLLGRAGTDEALAALELIAGGANGASAELRQTAFEAMAATATGRAASLLATQLNREDMDPEVLVEYLEALEETPSVAVTQLALSLLGHEDADVRDEAAWLIALNVDEQPSLVPDVLTALKAETDPAVRSRLYGALGGETAAEAQTILQMAQAEAYASTQIAGYKALGRMAAADGNGAAAQLFDAQAVPILTDAALNSPDFQIRFGAFVALRLARTEEATLAIRRLAAEAGDRRIAEAAAAATR